MSGEAGPVPGVREGRSIAMRLRWTLLVAIGLSGCNVGDSPQESRTLSAADSAAVQRQVRSFAAAVAAGVTREGPLAWRRYFEDTPSFFMAVNGQVIFPSGTAARDGIPQVALTFPHIELRWGDDLRIDPLTRGLAVVATSWHEVLTDPAGRSSSQAGFFTGLAEYRTGRWQFRDAHWSAPVSASAAMSGTGN
jgi:hypothetical protein